MPVHHLIRDKEESTICGIARALVTSALAVEEGQHPQKHDLILAACKRAGGLRNVCQDCRTMRRFPWPKDHGETQEDKLADDDEHWRQLDAAAREKSVDN